MRKKDLFFYKLLRPLVSVFLKIAFGYKCKQAKNLPENYIVLSNHATDFDPLLVGAAFPRQMYFVASEHIARWPNAYKFIKFAFEPIMRYKGASAASTVLEMIRHVKKGANVCMFAEGVRTWDGVTCPILPSTAKVIKTAKCGLVTFKLTGGYFASPMWSGASIRKGYLHGEVANVYTKEQLKEMSVEEIYTAITTDLYEDAYERQLANPKKYKGKNLAEHLERLMFICPKCGKRDTFHSEGNTVSCTSCGLTMHYDEYGMLDGAEFKTLKAFSDWQKEQVKAHIAAGEAYTATSGILNLVENHEETRICEGEVSMTAQMLKCGNTQIPVADITDLAMHGQQALVFSVGKTYYELRIAPGSNALKFFLFYKGI
ncbi:MAG: 1-acyl-sn-glycerol-3-phosphate acyltransferase [Firmicutes bacterium]|nr:1-acyl-sn-glycerol-3-phosphate acyltransferase [Bacillota bacterium]